MLRKTLEEPVYSKVNSVVEVMFDVTIMEAVLNYNFHAIINIPKYSCYQLPRKATFVVVVMTVVMMVMMVRVKVIEMTSFVLRPVIAYTCTNKRINAPAIAATRI